MEELPTKLNGSQNNSKKISKKILISLIIIIILIAVVGYFFVHKNGSSSLESESKTSNQVTKKDYLNVLSDDFNPSRAGKPNPQIKQEKPACCNHPYYHSVWRAFSNDGLSWQKEGKLFIDHASVPDVLIKEDGSQIIYYVDGLYDTLMCKIVKDGQLSDGNCIIYNFSDEKAWDPEVVKVDNYYRLYFVSPPKLNGQDNEMGSKIKTAVSRDGITWLEEGIALDGYGVIVDPTVIKTTSEWKMIYASEEEGLVLANSSDGKSFKVEASVDKISVGKSPHLTKIENKYAAYYCKQGINVSLSDDLTTWLSERIALAGEGNNVTCDPSVEKQSDGKFIMYYKKQSVKK